jgi:hypothetical protein
MCWVHDVVDRLRYPPHRSVSLLIRRMHVSRGPHYIQPSYILRNVPLYTPIALVGPPPRVLRCHWDPWATVDHNKFNNINLI